MFTIEPKGTDKIKCNLHKRDKLTPHPTESHE